MLHSILILGGGWATSRLLSFFKTNTDINFVKGILDDDKKKHNSYIENIKIIGDLSLSSTLIDKFKITEVIICIEKISAAKLESIIATLDINKVQIRIIPAQREMISTQKQIISPRPIKAEDLLGRSTIDFNQKLINEHLFKKHIFITGAGGSIGSEICHQLLAYDLASLTCLCRSEYSLYELQEKLAEENINNIKIRYYIGDIRDFNRIDALFKSNQPDIVFHAAAHKHVLYMETNETEAIKNNVIGTQNILQAAKTNQVSQFLLISTDKAVNAKSIMGASKRIAELLVEKYNSKQLKTCVVRFGNVLGSKGSVVPLFEKQILKGGPITITHPDVVRYFMTIPEAALLVINCVSISKGSEIFFLDMGKAIRIFDLVAKMIYLHGYKLNEDIQIKYTGLGKGEKLIEDLVPLHSKYQKTINSKIFVLDKNTFELPQKLESVLDTFGKKIDSLTRREIRTMIKTLIPEYNL